MSTDCCALLVSASRRREMGLLSFVFSAQMWSVPSCCCRQSGLLVGWFRFHLLPIGESEGRYDSVAQPCAAANPAGASRLQSLRPVRRVAELLSLGDTMRMKLLTTL